MFMFKNSDAARWEKEVNEKGLKDAPQPSEKQVKTNGMNRPHGSLLSSLGSGVGGSIMQCQSVV